MDIIGCPMRREIKYNRLSRRRENCPRIAPIGADEGRSVPESGRGRTDPLQADGLMGRFSVGARVSRRLWYHCRRAQSKWTVVIVAKICLIWIAMPTLVEDIEKSRGSKLPQEPLARFSGVVRGEFPLKATRFDQRIETRRPPKRAEARTDWLSRPFRISSGGRISSEL